MKYPPCMYSQANMSAPTKNEDVLKTALKLIKHLEGDKKKKEEPKKDEHTKKKGKWVETWVEEEDTRRYTVFEVTSILLLLSIPIGILEYYAFASVISSVIK